MDLVPFFQWCYQTDIGFTIRNSVWLFPAIEAFHLLGFGLTAGAMLVVNLRRPDQTAGRATRGERPAVAHSRRHHDDRVGRSALPGRIDQVPLQLRLLGEDELLAPSASLHVHSLSPRDANEVGFRPHFGRAIGRSDIAGPVGRRRLARALDRIFVRALAGSYVLRVEPAGSIERRHETSRQVQSG
jgi:hypothetical protein